MNRRILVYAFYGTAAIVGGVIAMSGFNIFPNADVKSVPVASDRSSARPGFHETLDPTNSGALVRSPESRDLDRAEPRDRPPAISSLRRSKSRSGEESASSSRAGAPSISSRQKDVRQLGSPINFSRDRLAKIGRSTSDIDFVSDRWDVARTSLDLGDGPPPRNRIDDLRAELQEQLGPEGGDAVLDDLLYAYGQPNRLELKKIYPRTLTARGGLEPGDILLTYDERPIYSRTELRDASTANRGDVETATIEIQRAEERLILEVETGYLVGQFTPVVIDTSTGQRSDGS